MGRYPSRVSVAESMLRTVVSVLLLGGVAVVVLRVAGVQRWWGPARRFFAPVCNWRR